MRSSRPSIALFLVLALLTMGGCASRSAGSAGPPGAPQTSLCTTARCLTEATMEPHYDACMTGLFNQSSQRRVKEAINAEFRYPFSDASGYFNWMKLGGSGPAPQEWCRYYAYRKVSSPYGRGFSLN